MRCERCRTVFTEPWNGDFCRECLTDLCLECMKEGCCSIPAESGMGPSVLIPARAAVRARQAKPAAVPKARRR